MSKEILKPHPERLHLELIASSLKSVEMHWKEINDELELRGIGRKDTPFTATVRMRMLSAFRYLDDLLSQQIPPFSPESIDHMLVLNHRVLYGTDQQLMSEYTSAMKATAEKFNYYIGPVLATADIRSKNEGYWCLSPFLFLVISTFSKWRERFFYAVSFLIVERISAVASTEGKLVVERGMMIPSAHDAQGEVARGATRGSLSSTRRGTTWPLRFSIFFCNTARFPPLTFTKATT
jgi:hypothetical protein